MFVEPPRELQQQQNTKLRSCRVLLGFLPKDCLCSFFEDHTATLSDDENVECTIIVCVISVS